MHLTPASLSQKSDSRFSETGGALLRVARASQTVDGRESRGENQRNNNKKWPHLQSPDVVYDPFVQVFGTLFVGCIGLMFVVRIALLIVDFLRQSHAERIELPEALLRELDSVDQEEIEFEIVEAVQSAGGSISLEQLLRALYGQPDAAQRNALILRLRDLARRAIVNYNPSPRAVISEANADASEEDSMTDTQEPEVS